MDFIFDPSLVLYLPLCELDGASFMSKDAYGHPYTVTGALWRPNGYYFDGSDDKVSIPDHPSLDVTSAVTLEAWVWHTTGASEYMIAKRLSGSDDAYGIIESSLKVRMHMWIGDVLKALSGDTDMTIQAWNHAVATYDGSYMRIFLNGALDCTPQAQTGDIDVTVNPVTVGWGFDNATTWDGLVGEVRIYNRALTPQEIQHNYLATKWRYR